MKNSSILGLVLGVATAFFAANTFAEGTKGIDLAKSGKLKEAVPFLETECAANNSESCFQLAAYFDKGAPAGSQDINKAIELYQKSCDGDFLNACRSLGEIYILSAPGVKANPKAGAALVEKACIKDHGPSCTLLGDVYYFGDLGEKDFAKAENYYLKACDLKEAQACFYAGDLNEYPESGEKNLEKAKAFYAKACAIDKITGCKEGEAVGKGSLTPEMIVAEEKECKSGKTKSCISLAEAFDEAKGSKNVDMVKAANYYELACQQNDFAACKSHGEILIYGVEGLTKNPELGMKSVEKACDGDLLDACNLGGDVWYYGDLGQKDFKKSEKFYVKACEMNDSISCGNLLEIYLSDELGSDSRSRALKTVEKACKNNNFKACVELGIIYEIGSGKPKNTKLANKYYRKACDAGEAMGCYGSGMLNFSAKATKPQGLKDLQSGCDKSHAMSCLALGKIYEKGDTNVKADKARAKKYYSLAFKADANNFEAKKALWR